MTFILTKDNPPTTIPLKLGLDVDGVISKYPRLFSVITKSLIECGHEVYIITDLGDETYRKWRENELKEWGIEYTELIITGEKEKFCKNNNIEFLIDDCREYFMKTKAHRILVGEIKSE